MKDKVDKRNGKIKILYLIDFFIGPEGGTENHLAYLVKSLDKDRFQSWIVVFHLRNNPLIESIRDSGTPVLYIPVKRYYGPMAILRAFQLRQLIKKEKIDIVQTFHFKSDFYGALVARWSGVKHIISSKRDMGHKKKDLHFFLSSKVRNLFQGIIVVSDAVGNVVRQREKVENDKLKTIHNGVHLDRFNPPTLEERKQIRTALGFQGSDFIVGMSGVFRPEKNYHILIEGAKLASEKIPEIKVLIMGGGPLLGRCKRQCRRLGIEDRVNFVGYTDEVSRYLKALDVGCLVSQCEGLSNSLLEKMATGLPLIATEVGGNPDVVTDGFNGFLIPPDDPSSLAEAILKLYKNPEERKQMGIRSRQRAEESFSMGRMIDLHEEYYQNLVNSKGKFSPPTLPQTGWSKVPS